MKTRPVKYTIHDTDMVQLLKDAGVQPTANAEHMVILHHIEGMVHSPGEDPLYRLIKHMQRHAKVT